MSEPKSGSFRMLVRNVRKQAERDARARRIESALLRLIAAKDEKDANGHTPRYRYLKQGAWEEARDAVSPSGAEQRGGG